MKLTIDGKPFTLTFRYDYIARDKKTNAIVAAEQHEYETYDAVPPDQTRRVSFRHRTRAILLSFDSETNKLTEYCIGASECSPKDRINKPVGRVLAFQRLLTNLDVQYPARAEESGQRRRALVDTFSRYCTRPIHDKSGSLRKKDADFLNPEKAYSRLFKRHEKLISEIRRTEAEMERLAELHRARRESRRPSRHEMLELLQSLGAGR